MGWGVVGGGKGEGRGGGEGEVAGTSSFEVR